MEWLESWHKACVCKQREHVDDSVKNGDVVDASFQAGVSVLPCRSKVSGMWKSIHIKIDLLWYTPPVGHDLLSSGGIVNRPTVVFLCLMLCLGGTMVPTDAKVSA